MPTKHLKGMLVLGAYWALNNDLTTKVIWSIQN